MDNFIKYLSIPSTILSLITTGFAIYTNETVNNLKIKQEQRDSISFSRDFKFKMFDYVAKSLEKDEKNRKATIVLVENMVENDKTFREGLRNSILSLVTPEEKKEVSETLNAFQYEKQAFRFLLDKNLDSAKVNFNESYKSFPTLHNVEEINNILKDKDSKSIIWTSLYKEIYPKHQWGMSNEVINEFINKTK
jgi:hypothetical protein